MTLGFFTSMPKPLHEALIAQVIHRDLAGVQVQKPDPRLSALVIWAAAHLPIRSPALKLSVAKVTGRSSGSRGESSVMNRDARLARLLHHRHDGGAAVR